MAIVEMSKFTLLTLAAHKEELLAQLQKSETVHFQNLKLEQEADDSEFNGLLSAYSGEEAAGVSGKLAKVSFAISKIEPYVEKPKGLAAAKAAPKELTFDEFEDFTRNYDFEAVYEELKRADENIKALRVERGKLRADDAALSGWLKLDAGTGELDALKTAKYLLGTLPKASAEPFAEELYHDYPASYAEFLDTVKDETGVLIILHAEDFDGASALAKAHSFSKAPLNLLAAPAEVIKANEARAKETEKLEEEELTLIKNKAGEYESLRISEDYLKTAAARVAAGECLLKTQETCVVGGWLPKADAARLKSLLRAVCGQEFYLEVADVEKDSAEVPIKLKNGRFVSAFENITEMYSLPKYNEIDPTPLLAPFYFLFFGIMVGDAGYGLVIFLGSLIALNAFNLKPGMKRFMRFFNYLGIATMLVGFIVFGSVFGFTVFKPLSYMDAEGALKSKALLDSQLDIPTMLLASIGLGVIQILVGLAVKGYVLIRDGKALDALFDSGFWITTVISLVGLLAGTALGNPQIAGPCKWVLIASIIGLACTQGRASKSLGGKIGNGIYSVYNITSYVGDFVSYTRLVALALSGAYIAYSFNLMGGFLPLDEKTGATLMSGAMRATFGVIIMLLGAALNLGLSALGAYVHTCRLQYVEYFGKFYEGGGKPFKAFAMKNSFAKVKDPNNE
ncbi:MAG: V-type ATP synthase subunit I [Clostridiales bacterium]|jgi:V/A-type H+-transporting ATPase subunit I|nr:V-type ATP synthase subunit I [Clostridiales bacterium]